MARSSVVYHQDGVEFSLEGDEIPGFLKGSKKGNVFITTQKVSHFERIPYNAMLNDV